MRLATRSFLTGVSPVGIVQSQVTIGERNQPPPRLVP